MLILVAAVALPCAPAAAHAPAGWAPDVDAARAYAEQRRGVVSFAVRTEKRVWGFRSTRTVPSASVLKAMLMVAYLNHPHVRGRDLRRADRRLLSPMIRRSDNATATRIRNYVGYGRLRRLARIAGMTRFRTARIWGHCRVNAFDQTKLFLRLERFVVPRHRRTAFALLAAIVPSQRWGIARAVPAGWKIHFKGGWGSGTGAVDHQVALLRRGNTRVALAIMTTSQGTHAYGKETLRGVARRLLRGLGS